MEIKKELKKGSSFELANQFFEKYRNYHKETKQSALTAYSSFFKQYKKNYQYEQRIVTTLKQGESFFQQFPPLYKELKQSGMMINIWSMLGIAHNEVTNCKIIAWLLSNNGSHGLGNKFLKNLLYFLIPDTFPTNIFSHYSVTCERIFNKDITDRIDICIENAQFLFFIEAKIDSIENVTPKLNSNKENDYQLTRYHKKLNTFPHQYKKLFYLTKYGTPPHDNEIQKDVGILTWKMVADALQKTVNNHNNYSPYHYIMFNQLINHFKEL